VSTLQADASDEQEFSDALSQSKRVVLAYVFLFAKGEEHGASTNQSRDLEAQYLPGRWAFGRVLHPEFGEAFACGVCDGRGFEASLPELDQNAEGGGFFNMVADSDGVTRRQQLVIRHGERYYPSLAVAAVLAFKHLPSDRLVLALNSHGVERVDFGPRRIPTNTDGAVQIDFRGPARTFPTYSLYDVLEGRIPAVAFKDKIVLIGATAAQFGDAKGVPFQEVSFPGVEVHANVVDNLLTGNFVRHGPREQLADVVLIVLLGLAPGALMRYLSRWELAVLVTIILYGSFLWLAYYVFVAAGIWVSVVFPSCALGLSYLGTSSALILSRGREPSYASISGKATR
jgi:adenylate cyclase